MMVSYDLMERLNKADATPHETTEVKDVSNTSKSVRPQIKKDQNTLNIQNFIVSNTELPIGKDNNRVPDGGYGPTTHASLQKMLQSRHTNPVVQSIVDALNKSSLVKATYEETLPNIAYISNIVSAQGQDRARGEIPTPKTTYVIPLNIDGKEVSFDLAIALRTPGDFEYNLALAGLLDRNADVQTKTKQLENATYLILQSLPANLPGTRERVQTISRKIEEAYNKPAEKGGGLMEFLRNRLNFDMQIIPRGNLQLEQDLASWIYSVNPRMLSDSSPSAEITNMAALVHRLPDIQKYLRVLRRKLEGRNGR